jgi:hypothetical protein
MLICVTVHDEKSDRTATDEAMITDSVLLQIISLLQESSVVCVSKCTYNNKSNFIS